jgi:uncharacterized protein (TIGR03435 family)
MKSTAAVASLALTLGLASQPAAQSPGGPAFEVVSIKPTNPDAAGPNLPPVGGRFTASNRTLRQLVGLAYNISESRIDGGPEWEASRQFDIQAKAADPVAGMEAMRPMLKALLADRFQLKVHSEDRERPIYALVTARDDGQLSANVTKSNADCSKAEEELTEAEASDPGTIAKRLQAGSVPCAIMPALARAPGSMTMRANGASMAVLATFLTAFTGRTVRDRTGLTGIYDWEMTFDRARAPRTTPPSAGNSPLDTAVTADNPSMTTALQEQLGLKLEPTRGPVEFLVIDSAALPLAN